MSKYNLSSAAGGATIAKGVTIANSAASSAANATHSIAASQASAKKSSKREYELLITSPQSLLSTQSDIKHTSNCLKAMAHPLRLKILCLLSKLEQISVLDLVEAVGTSQSNISQHLSILKEKGLLSCDKEANKVYYKLADEDLGELIHSIRKAFCNKNLSNY